MMRRRWLVSMIACALGLGAAACSGLLGFDELTSDGFTDGGGAGEADVLEGAAPGADGGALDAGPLDLNVDPPDGVVATAAACMVHTLIKGPGSGGEKCPTLLSEQAVFCGVTGLVAASDTMVYASLHNGTVVSFSDWSTKGVFNDMTIRLSDGGTLDVTSALAGTAPNLIVAEPYQLDTVSVMTKALTPVLGSGESGNGDGPDGGFKGIRAIALSPGTTSKLWIADGKDFRRADISAPPTLTTIYPAVFSTPTDVTETPSGVVYVTAIAGPGGGAGVYHFREGDPSTSITPVLPAMTSPSAITSDGTVVIVGDNNGRVYTIDPTASMPAIELLAGGNLGTEKDDACRAAVIEQPTALALDSHHDVLLADGTTGSLRKIERNLGALDVRWNVPSTSSPSDPIVSYEATARAGANVGGSCTCKAPLVACTITGLPSHIELMVTVVAHTQIGVTKPSSPLTPATTN